MYIGKKLLLLSLTPCLLGFFSVVTAGNITCGNGIVESPSPEVSTRYDSPHELCDGDVVAGGYNCDNECNIILSGDLCEDLDIFDYNDDNLIGNEDLRYLLDQLVTDNQDSCDWNRIGETCCPEGKICHSNCSENFSPLDITGIVNQIRSGEVRDYEGCFEGVEQCPTQPTTCSDYDAFDYNDDGLVDGKDVTYIRNAGRVRNPLMTECDGTVLLGQRGGEFCCPEGKICDLYCAKNGFSKGVIHQMIDAYTLQKAIRQKRLPTSCQDDMPVCEETSYPEVEFIRMRGTGRVIAIRYRNTDGSTANMTRSLEASKLEITKSTK